MGDATKAFRSIVSEGISTRVEALAACDADTMWNTLASIIKDAAKDTLGVAIGTSKTHTAQRECWWLCEEVQSTVAVKQARFRELLSYREGNEDERLRALERYKEAKRQAKKAVAQPERRRRRDLGNICFIKDEEGQTITGEEEIKKRWEEYFSSLFNMREPEGHEEGQDQIPIEAWKSLGDEGSFWITILFNKTFTSARMPEEWRLSEVIPIFKNKGNPQVCSNYRGIKLFGHTMKLWERVIERRLRTETLVSKNQFGFMPERSSVEAIHLIRSLMEKYKERQRDLHMAFLDLEKAYDSIPRDLI
ncbi:retrovirus-related pol polyprotein LINE-1 [Tanacetum coccineum]